MKEGNGYCIGEGPRSRKLREAFHLAVDKVIESLSAEAVCSSFPNIYRESSDALKAFRSELVERLRDVMIREFEDISTSIGVFSKLDLIDQLLRREEFDVSLGFKDLSRYLEEGTRTADEDPSAAKSRKRAKVSSGIGSCLSLNKSSQEPPLLLIGTSACVGLKVLQANDDHLAELTKQLSDVEESTLSLSAELSQLYGSFIECTSDTNKRIFGIVPECVPSPAD